VGEAPNAGIEYPLESEETASQASYPCGEAGASAFPLFRALSIIVYRNLLRRRVGSGHDRLDHVAEHVRQPVVAALELERQLRVLDVILAEMLARRWPEMGAGIRPLKPRRSCYPGPRGTAKPKVSSLGWYTPVSLGP